MKSKRCQPNTMIINTIRIKNLKTHILKHWNSLETNTICREIFNESIIGYSKYKNMSKMINDKWRPLRKKKWHFSKKNKQKTAETLYFNSNIFFYTTYKLSRVSRPNFSQVWLIDVPFWNSILLYKRVYTT